MLEQIHPEWTRAVRHERFFVSFVLFYFSPKKVINTITSLLLLLKAQKKQLQFFQNRLTEIQKKSSRKQSQQLLLK